MKRISNRSFKEALMDRGADLVGIADLAELHALPVTPPRLTRPFQRAVSVAVALPKAVFLAITDSPTPEYAAIYQTVNRQLDDLALFAAKTLEHAGCHALPVPASQVLDREKWTGAISHKAVALAAGIGWQGKNLLIITPRYGSRVRLVTVLTDAEITADVRVPNRCGKCSYCRDACPVGAIRGVSTEIHYATRNEAMRFSRCVEKLTNDFAARDLIGAPICGICIRACPFSTKGASHSAPGPA